MTAGTGRLITLVEPQSAAAEAYRGLRTSIQFSSVDNPIHSLLVTSSEADEGKSVALCNLAVTFAQAGISVVIVDCDLRRPSVHEIFDLANDKGLTTALLDNKDHDLPLQRTVVANLRALTSGPLPPNPVDLLGSRKMRGLVDALKASSELVLFDSPPVALVSDAAVLASMVDGVILVVGAGKTRREVAGRAKLALENANARILGVVLSNARLDTKLSRYYGSRRQ